MSATATMRAPSVMEALHDKESRNFNDDEIGMLSDNPDNSSDNSNNFNKRKIILSDTPALSTNNRDMLSNTPTMLNNSPSMISDFPSMVPERISMLSSSMSESASIRNGKQESEEEENSSSADEKQNQISGVSLKRGKRKKYQKYTPEDRFAIGKFCFEHGPAAARRAFQDRYPEMSESVTRGFRDKYKLIIGETAVYEFEQQKQKEYQRRTGPLPRGRPRKYKPVEEDEAPASMVVRNPSPPANDTEEHSPNGVTQSEHSSDVSSNDERNSSSKDPNHYILDKRLARHGLGIDEINSSKKHSTDYLLKTTEYTRSEKLRIGKMCAQEGLHSTLRRYKFEYPSLKEELVIDFHKKYLESEGVSTTMQPQVFILEADENSTSIGTEGATKTITSSSISKVYFKDRPVTSESSSNYKDIAENLRNGYRKQHVSEDYILAKNSDRQAYLRGYPERTYTEAADSYRVRSPLRNSPHSYSPPRVIAHSSTRRVSKMSPPPQRTSPPHKTNQRTSKSIGTIPTSAVHSPIIHYPKPPIDYALHYKETESRGAKREYSSTLEPHGFYERGGYPYDRQPHEQSPPHGTYLNESSVTRGKRFKYQKYTPEDRFNIGKLCNEIGLGATLKVYREQFPRLNESVVRTFRNKYRELLQHGNGVAQTEAIERKPSRRSISTHVESEVVSQLQQFKLSQIGMSVNLVFAVSENVLATKDPREVAGMRSLLTKDWANSLLWKHKLIEKPLTNLHGVCCEKCKTKLICPKCN